MKSVLASTCIVMALSRVCEADARQSAPREGEVQLPDTALFWLRCPIGQEWEASSCQGSPKQLQWKEALKACPAGYRLPFKKEFIELLGGCEDAVKRGNKGGCQECATSKTCSSMFGEDTLDYWTSLPFAGDPSYAWFVDFEYGSVDSYGSKDSSCHVRCLRSTREDEDAVLETKSVPEPTAKSLVIIWGGGKTEGQARKSSRHWEQLSEVFNSAGLSVGHGFPQVVKSDVYEGLNPGFWISVLGFCNEPEGQQVLEVLRLMHPGVYSREVAVPETEASCPHVSESIEGLRAHGQVHKIDELRRLRIISLDKEELGPRPPWADASYEPEPDTVKTIYYFFLVEKRTNYVLDSVTAEGEVDFSGRPHDGAPPYQCTAHGIERKKDAFVLSRTCEAQAGECGAMMSSDYEYTVRVRGNRLELKERHFNQEHMECD